MKLAAVIYDMDGVIIDSEDSWRQAEVQSLAELGIQLTNEDLNSTSGLRIDEAIQKHLDTYQINANPKTIGLAVQNQVCHAISTNGEALPGLYTSLKTFSKIPIGLASSSAPPVIDAVFKRLHLEEKFTAISSGADMQFGKPHPEVYLDNLNKLQTPTHQTLAIEDSIHGMVAAKAAKLKVAVIPAPYNRNAKAWGLADYYFDSLEELSQHFAAAVPHT